MITIDQLLESVDLNFEPRWVTKDKSGDVYLYEHKPTKDEKQKQWFANCFNDGVAEYTGLKLAEFADKPWQECIYEVPRKTTGKIGRFTLIDFDNVNNANGLRVSVLTASAFNKLNELVEAVNELKGRSNG